MQTSIILLCLFGSVFTGPTHVSLLIFTIVSHSLSLDSEEEELEDSLSLTFSSFQVLLFICFSSALSSFNFVNKRFAASCTQYKLSISSFESRMEFTFQNQRHYNPFFVFGTDLYHELNKTVKLNFRAIKGNPKAFLTIKKSNSINQ